MKARIIVLVILTAIILSYGCKDKDKEGIVNPNTETIELLSFSNKGCHSLPKDSPILENKKNLELPELSKTKRTEYTYWDYFGDSLMITSSFETHCSAVIKDSTVTTENKISIFLRDINKNVARCTCQVKEEFVFKAESPKAIEITIYYKAIYSTRHDIIVHGTIEI
jgi:hypothetical protein